jgi:very-short-patch-repair endonuclease
MTRVPAVEAALRSWFRAHDGLITRADALAIGLTPKQIEGRLDRREWESLFPKVYRATASQRSAHQTLRAACLAGGPGAVASHQSAAWLLGLLARPPATPHITTRAGDRHGQRLPGVIVHRSTDLDRGQTKVTKGIPHTDALRTLVDLGATVSIDALTDAVDRALADRLVTIRRLARELDRVGRSGRRGAGALRRLLTDRGLVGAPHPSVLESKTIRLFRRHHLPEPKVELTTGPDGEYRIDFAYDLIRLAVEVDGYVWHFSPEHQQRDHARRNRLQAQGWHILVYTWRDVVDEPARVASEIAALYAKLSAA